MNCCVLATSCPEWVCFGRELVHNSSKTDVALLCRLAKEQFGEYVDYWVTFNEPNIFVILTHCTGSFPPGFRPSLASIALCMAPMGAYSRAMGAITEAHFSAYEILQEG